MANLFRSLGQVAMRQQKLRDLAKGGSETRVVAREKIRYRDRLAGNAFKIGGRHCINSSLKKLDYGWSTALLFQITYTTPYAGTIAVAGAHGNAFCRYIPRYLIVRTNIAS